MAIFDFGRRRIQRIRYSHYIALPPAWLKNHKVGKHSQVSIHMNESGDLIVRPMREGTDG